jgi:hypothetical protein
VTVGGTGVAVAVGEGDGVGVQLGVKVKVGRGVRVGRGVSVGTRTNSVPTEQPKLANKAVTSTKLGNNLWCVIYFFTNQTKSQYLWPGSELYENVTGSETRVPDLSVRYKVQDPSMKGPGEDSTLARLM